MNVQNTILTKEEKKLITLKAQEARDKSFKLVVKIISWETGSMDSNAIKTENKISPVEWATYKRHLLTISKSESVEKVKEKLSQAYKSIKEHGGFK